MSPVAGSVQARTASALAASTAWGSDVCEKANGIVARERAIAYTTLHMTQTSDAPYSKLPNKKRCSRIRTAAAVLSPTLTQPILHQIWVHCRIVGHSPTTHTYHQQRFDLRKLRLQNFAILRLQLRTTHSEAGLR